jgi:hypothetical protein
LFVLLSYSFWWTCVALLQKKLVAKTLVYSIFTANNFHDCKMFVHKCSTTIYWISVLWGKTIPCSVDLCILYHFLFCFNILKLYLFCC